MGLWDGEWKGVTYLPETFLERMRVIRVPDPFDGDNMFPIDYEG